MLVQWGRLDRGLEDDSRRLAAQPQRGLRSCRVQAPQEPGQQQDRLAARHAQRAVGLDPNARHLAVGKRTFDRLAQHIGGCHRFRLQRASPRRGEHRLEQALHLRHATFEPLQRRVLARHRRGIVGQHFDGASDHRKRRAQLVAGIGQEGLLARIGVDQARLVGVDRRREPAELVVTEAVREPRCLRQHGQRLDLHRQLAQRAQRNAGDEPGEDAEQGRTEHEHEGDEQMQMPLHDLDVAEIDHEHEPPGGRVEHPDVDVVVARILVHAGRQRGIGWRQVGRVAGVAAQAVGLRQRRRQAIGQAQAVVFGLATQDLVGDDVLVVLGQSEDDERGERAQHEAEQHGQPGEARAQRQRRGHCCSMSR